MGSRSASRLAQIRERKKKEYERGHQVKVFDGKYFATEHLEFYKQWMQLPHKPDQVKLLVSPTGSSKTYTTVRELVKMGEKVVFCLPNIGTSVELANSDDYDAVACYGDYSVFQSAKNDDLGKGKVIFMTYKQLGNLVKCREQYRDYYLIIDEAHCLTIQNEINRDAISALTKMMASGGYFKNIMYISATHTPVVLTFGADNMQVLEFRRKENECRYSIHNIIIPEKGSLVDAAYWVMDKVNKKALVLSPTDKTMNRVLGEHSDAVVIDADSKRKCPIFNSIINEKVVPADAPKFIIMTDLISSGLNLMNEDIENVIIVGTTDQTLIRQFPARLRKAKHVNVYVVDKFSYMSDGIPVTRESLVQEADENADRLNETAEGNHLFNRRLEMEDHIITYVDGDVNNNYTIFEINDYSIGAALWKEHSQQNILKTDMFYPEGESTLDGFALMPDDTATDLASEIKEIKDEKKLKSDDEKAQLLNIVEDFQNDPFGNSEMKMSDIKEEYELTAAQEKFMEEIIRKMKRYPEVDAMTTAKLVVDKDFELTIRYAVYRKHLDGATTRVNSILQNILDLEPGDEIDLKNEVFEGTKSGTNKKGILMALWEVAEVKERPWIGRLMEKKPKLDDIGLGKEEVERLEKSYIRKPTLAKEWKKWSDLEEVQR